MDQGFSSDEEDASGEIGWGPAADGKPVRSTYPTGIDWYDQMSMPALLRHARTAYAFAIGGALAAQGFDDLPRNGSYVLGSVARHGSPLGQIINQLGISKQAAGQLVDTLVARGYLDRSVDAEDRRRLVVSLTPRGQMAAAVGRAATDMTDALLTTRVGTAAVAQTRNALTTLIRFMIDPEFHLALEEQIGQGSRDSE